MAFVGSSRVLVNSRSSGPRAPSASASMLLPHVVYAAPGDDVGAGTAVGRSGKRKGDLLEGRRKWSGFGGFRGFGVELISVLTLRGLHL
jgi:hypothetical protein